MQAASPTGGAEATAASRICAGTGLPLGRETDAPTALPAGSKARFNELIVRAKQVRVPSPAGSMRKRLRRPSRPKRVRARDARRSASGYAYVV